MCKTIQTQRSTDKDLQFEFRIGVRTGKGPLPDYSGPFVQGPSGGRFVYIDEARLTGGLVSRRDQLEVTTPYEIVKVFGAATRDR